MMLFLSAFVVLCALALAFAAGWWLGHSQWPDDFDRGREI